MQILLYTNMNKKICPLNLQVCGLYIFRAFQHLVIIDACMQSPVSIQRSPLRIYDSYYKDKMVVRRPYLLMIVVPILIIWHIYIEISHRYPRTPKGALPSRDTVRTLQSYSCIHQRSRTGPMLDRLDGTNIESTSYISLFLDTPPPPLKAL